MMWFHNVVGRILFVRLQDTFPSEGQNFKMQTKVCLLNEKRQVFKLFDDFSNIDKLPN